jgi:hypothetical protein
MPAQRMRRMNDRPKPATTDLVAGFVASTRVDAPG